jgi:hypothetical protein
VIDWYKKSPEIEKDLTPRVDMGLDSTTYEATVGTDARGTPPSGSYPSATIRKEVELEPTDKEEDSTINSQGAGLLDGLTAPDFNAEIDRIMAEMEAAFLKIMNRIELMREVSKCQ